MVKWLKTSIGKAHVYVNIDLYEKIKIEDQHDKFSVVAIKGKHREVLFESLDLSECIKFCKNHLLTE